MVRWTSRCVVLLTAVVALCQPAAANKLQANKPSPKRLPQNKSGKGPQEGRLTKEPSTSELGRQTQTGGQAPKPASELGGGSGGESLLAAAKQMNASSEGLEHGGETAHRETNLLVGHGEPKPPAGERVGVVGRVANAVTRAAAKAAFSPLKAVSGAVLNTGVGTLLGKSVKIAGITVTIDHAAIMKALDTAIKKGPEALRQEFLETEFMRIEMPNYATHEKDGFANYRIQVRGGDVRFQPKDFTMSDVVVDLRLLDADPEGTLAKVREAHGESARDRKTVFLTWNDEKGAAFLARHKARPVEEHGGEAP